MCVISSSLPYIYTHTLLFHLSHKGYNLLFNPHSSERPFSPRWYFLIHPGKKHVVNSPACFGFGGLFFINPRSPDLAHQIKGSYKKYKGHLISVGPKIFPIPQIWLAGRVGGCPYKSILFPTEFAPWGIGLIWELPPYIYIYIYNTHIYTDTYKKIDS